MVEFLSVNPSNGKFVPAKSCEYHRITSLEVLTREGPRMQLLQNTKKSSEVWKRFYSKQGHKVHHGRNNMNLKIRLTRNDFSSATGQYESLEKLTNLAELQFSCLKKMSRILSLTEGIRPHSCENYTRSTTHNVPCYRISLPAQSKMSSSSSFNRETLLCLLRHLRHHLLCKGFPAPLLMALIISTFLNLCPCYKLQSV